MLITPEKRMNWEKTFRAMQADGVPIPVVKDHKAGSEATLGYVYDVRQNGDWWEELHGYIGDGSLDVKAGSLDNLFAFDHADNGPNKLFLDPSTGARQ